MDLSKFTAAERAALREQLLAEEQAEQDAIAKQRDDYKGLVNETVIEQVAELQKLSQQMMQAKRNVFNSFATVIDLKNELFNVKEDRRSDTFSSTDGKMSVTIGNRTNEGWDDTVNVGIEKVKTYIKSLAKDDNSAVLVDTIMGLIAKDRKGNLKASKVLELEKLANKTKDDNFLDGIKIIKEAYRPQPSCQFIAVQLRGEDGKEVALPLSMSSIE
jgi:hypothetical protein